jgi:hypothetical protein
LGYQFLVRSSLAAVASLGQCAGALAGTIAGAVTFPTQFVPSMTVYVAGLDASRVRSLRLARGQTSFTVEVPPGRYLVFLTPNEPGAPAIYGAYTQYSLCSRQDAGPCEDHALVPVAITPRAPRAAVLIDDWYLTDEVAQEIDRIRGGEAVGSFGSEPLGAPRFSEYPSEPYEAPGLPKIDFGGSDLSEGNREIVEHALSSGPNFAGHVTAVLTRCGPECSRIVLVDWTTGAIEGLPPQRPRAEIEGALPCRPDEALLFRRDSRLLSVSRVQGPVVITQYYVWNQKNAALTQSGEYQRSAQTFCAVAAR